MTRRCLLFVVLLALTVCAVTYRSDADRTCGVSACNANGFTCMGSQITATTQCQGAPGSGLSLYVQDFAFSDSVTALGVSLISGTGTNCGSGTAQVTPIFNLGTNGNMWMDLQAPPVKLPANTELCCSTGGATAFSCFVVGFTAP